MQVASGSEIGWALLTRTRSMVSEIRVGGAGWSGWRWVVVVDDSLDVSEVGVLGVGMEVGYEGCLVVVLLGR